MNRDEVSVLKRFVECMRIELDNNSHKGTILNFKDFNSIITELEYHIDNADKSDLIAELQDRDFDFSSEASIDEMIDRIEMEGYTVTYNEDGVDDSLDIIDSNRLDEIVSKFISANFSEREDMYNLITNSK